MQTVMVISFSSTITNTDRAVLKIENVSSFSPINMDRKLTTSLYDVLSMHATYAPLYEMHAASADVYATLDDVYATVHTLDATLRNLDAFPDDRIVAAMDEDERVAIAMDRKGAVDKVSKK